MKKIYTRLMLLCALALTGSSLTAQAEVGDTFEAENEGNTFRYTVTDDVNRYVEVSKEFEQSYSGIITIPSTVTDVNASKTYTVTGIGANAFDECGFSGIVIPEGITTIKGYAFRNCVSLDQITLPNSVTTLEGDSHFSGCTNLHSVTLGTGIISIPENMFYGCSQLSIINSEAEEVINTTITTVGEKALYGTVYLSSHGDGGVYLGKALYCYKGTAPESFEVADGTVSITKDAFYDKTTLKSITLPASLESIGWWAFYNCTGLTTVIFNGTSQLKNIGINAFVYCSLTSITLPASLKSIGAQAFWSCSGLTSVTFKGNSVPLLGTNVFYECSALAKIYVPAASVTAYKSTTSTNWTPELKAMVAPRQHTVTVGDAGYATLFLDYSATIPSGVEAYYVTEATSGKAAMMSVNAYISAYNGFILKAVPGDYTFVETTEEIMGPFYNMLIGSTYPKTVSESGHKYYKLVNETAGVGFYWGTPDGTSILCKANKAYLDVLGGGAPAPNIRLEFPATGITKTTATEEPSVVVYTPQGIQVSGGTTWQEAKQALPAGLYIVNGKKMVNL